MKKASLILIFTVLAFVASQAQTYKTHIDKKADDNEMRVLEWRRYLHQNPELSNREFKTAEYIAQKLKSLGLVVQTGIAKTGVVALLKGDKPGPCVALRADMDGLPVSERTPIAFASTAKGTYNGQEVGIMHACGHDTHMAMLLGAAEILAGMKKDIKGTIKFIFQPAEEGAPRGEEGGAKLMIAEGVLENPKVEAIFGIHINAQTEVGNIRYKPEGTMASVDIFRITVKGKQSHGAYPWLGIDPIVVGSQIVMGLQTIVSRQLNLPDNAAVITVGVFQGGVRSNIIPEEVKMEGTIRALDIVMQKIIHERIKNTATKIAESAGATAIVEIDRTYPITFNDSKLTDKMLPTLQKTAGKDHVLLSKAVTGAEDFSFYQEKVPGLFVFVGGKPKDKDPQETAAHHTPDFFIDESGLKLGVKTYCMLALDYLEMKR
ncbi:MAG: amidohydrolase [Verrucomicrobia bacterium]|nr:amidohydrolase [Cytophagales bacterium]